MKNKDCLYICLKTLSEGFNDRSKALNQEITELWLTYYKSVEYDEV